MKTFSGFPDGELKMSALPEMFYTGLLPLIDDLLEMKITVACFRLCWQKSGLVRWTTSAELMHDPALSDVSEQIGNGVLMAVRRGSIVGATIDRDCDISFLTRNWDRPRRQRSNAAKRSNRSRRSSDAPISLCCTSRTSGR